MQPETHRNDKYSAGYVPATVSLKVASRLSGMKTGFTAAIAGLVPKEIAIQGLLNGAGVFTIQYPFYLNFGRELWGLTYRGINGASLLLLAATLRAKYVSYGLALVTLDDIALSQFGLSIPPP